MKEPTTDPVIDPATTDLPVTPPPVAIVPAVLRPLPQYPAYILDQCGAIWGIPASLQGEYHKVLVKVETADGAIIPSSELDIFTLDGVLYVKHVYVDANGDQNSDTYKQKDGVIEITYTDPEKPAEDRVTYDGTKWKIETSIINGAKFSYLYNLDPVMIEAQGNSGGKGARMGAWVSIMGYVELDKGILIMTPNGSLFYPQNRACGNSVSEYGRLWK